MADIEQVDTPSIRASTRAREELLKATNIRFTNQNKLFWNNLSLAASMAFYITLFGLPVIWGYMNWYVFGENTERIVDGVHVRPCPSNMFGWKANSGTATAPKLVDWDPNGKDEKYMWCGLCPGSYVTWWPNVIQTAVFTVYRNTGSTMKLAWQCAFGTMTAVLNLWLMTYIFPEGARSEHYVEWVAWLDLVLVLFLYLASKADVNTMMWGMNWTVQMMLHFMNPETGPVVGTVRSWIPGINVDAETTGVLLTSLLGCVLALLATVFPRPLLNIRRVHDDAILVIDGMAATFDDILEYYCGSAETPKRYQIYGRIDTLAKTVADVANNLEDSFWETFNLFRYGRMRALYREFNETIKATEDEMYCIRVAVQQCEFHYQHREFARKLGPIMKDIVHGALKVMRECTACCRDGDISLDEQRVIEPHILFVEAKQFALRDAYREVMQVYPYLAPDLAADNLFAFSVSQWAAEITGFARRLPKVGDEYSVSKNFCVKLGHEFVMMSAEVFDPRHMLAKEQLRFTVMNLLPIMITYIMAMYVHASIFVQYSATMVGTLTLLVTYDFGATFFINVQRLMGTTFGNVLPLLSMSMIQLMDCENPWRVVMHSFAVFTFFFACNFMYYASDQWAQVGVLIAGFGAPPLVTACYGDLDAHYQTRYKDIAQTVIALLLKMAVGSLLSAEEPRDVAVRQLGLLGSEVLVTFKNVFEGDSAAAAKNMETLKKLLTECEDIASKCDPALEMVPGPRTRFRYELMNTALTQIRLLLSDLAMFKSATFGADPAEGCIHDIMSREPAYSTVSADVVETLQVTFEVLQALLKHDVEEPLETEAVEKLRGMAGIMELNGLLDLYQQISASASSSNGEGDLHDRLSLREDDNRLITEFRQTRLTLAVNALALATRHTGEITEACFKNMLYA